MTTPLLPLFPLGTVLLPGAPLPLRIFEARYRRLVADLLELDPPDRRFGVVAIREGREVGVDGVRALHAVGCIAFVLDVSSADDGTYELATVGTTRFALRTLDTEQPYLRGSVDSLGEPIGPVEGLVDTVSSRYVDYRSALGRARGGVLVEPELPTDPRLLSYLVAATVVADTPDRQLFLAQPDAAGRLAAESRWLWRETALLGHLSAVPAGALVAVPSSIN